MQTPEPRRGRSRTRGRAITARLPLRLRTSDGVVAHPAERLVHEKIGREMRAVSRKNTSARG
jgi:hypothetical protein